MNCTKEKINDEIKSYKHRGKVNRNQIPEQLLSQHNGSSLPFWQQKHLKMTNDFNTQITYVKFFGNK